MANDDTNVERYLLVGTSVVFHSDPFHKSGPRYSTVIRGWRNPAYVLLDRPKTVTGFAAMRENQPCVIRFVNEGRACAFDAIVLDWDTRQYHSYCRVSWPRYVTTVAFRKFERIRVEIPCKIESGNNTMEGELQDLSIGGSRIAVSEPLEVGLPVLVSFTLPDGREVERLKGVVRNAQRGVNERWFHGCEFLRGQLSVESDIAFFITASLGRAEERAEEKPAILIIDNNAADTMLLRRLFEARGYEIILATSTVDGISRLRISPPSAVLVSSEQKDLSGLQIVRLLRATRGLEQMPLYLYGGKDPALQSQGQAAGATAYLPTTTTAPQIVNIVAKAVGIKEDAEVITEA